jgi:hypothetical protein
VTGGDAFQAGGAVLAASRKVALLPPPLWLKFENFLADMGEKPEGELSLDRIIGCASWLSPTTVV